MLYNEVAIKYVHMSILYESIKSGPFILQLSTVLDFQIDYD